MRFKGFIGFIFLFFFAQTAWGDIDTVQVGDFTFVPASLTIQAGDTVVWKVAQECCLQHTTTRSSSPKIWNSGPLALGATFRVVFSFADSGTFSYFCSPHQGIGMTGSVTALPIASVPNAGALSWLGLLLLGMSLTAAGIWILERERKTA